MERIPRRGKLSLPVLLTVVGGDDGGVVVVPDAATAMLNAANWPFRYPSLAVITMFEYVPTLPAAGVPDNRPVVLLKLAQDGAFEMLNTILSPFGSTAVG